MSRLPLLAPDRIPAALRAQADGVIINLWRTFAHATGSVEPLARFGATLFAEHPLSAVDRELVILTLATRYHSDYEWAQHVPISASVGVTDAQRAAISRRAYSDAEFTDAHAALMLFAAAAADHPTVPDDVYSAVAQHYSDEAIMQTLMLVGFYFLVARTCSVLQVPVDALADNELVHQARRVNAE